jgi:rhamnopyranosyl-N-acetylglucosaminyl-diphospho-decaprenol beta-1,3/1,4-galactofuranosyltransferase
MRDMNNSHPGITAVIVTYRNPAMLKNLLEDLLDQTRVLLEIIVVDNSTDNGTADMIRTRFPGITYSKMPENGGSAGGFREGIQRAVKRADYVLTLDDDVRMPVDAVEKLLEGFQAQERIDDRTGAVRAAGRVHPFDVPTSMSLFAWRGTLIKRSAIVEVGLPESEYFLYADDLEYSLRLSEAGYHFFWIPASRIIECRNEGKKSTRMMGGTIHYYGDAFRLYYAMRNSIDAYRRHCLPGEAVRTILYGFKVMAFILIFAHKGSPARMKAILNGMHDGVRSRLGKVETYLPE